MRLKNYAAASGYVYSYGFEERRMEGEDEHFAFRLLLPKGFLLVNVVLPASAMVQNRVLSANERYAIAKMSLFAAFDERPDPVSMSEPVIVTVEGAARILRELDLI